MPGLIQIDNYDHFFSGIELSLVAPCQEGIVFRDENTFHFFLQFPFKKFQMLSHMT